MEGEDGREVILSGKHRSYYFSLGCWSIGACWGSLPLDLELRCLSFLGLGSLAVLLRASRAVGSHAAEAISRLETAQLLFYGDVHFLVRHAARQLRSLSISKAAVLNMEFPLQDLTCLIKANAGTLQHLDLQFRMPFGGEPPADVVSAFHRSVLCCTQLRTLFLPLGVLSAQQALTTWQAHTHLAASNLPHYYTAESVADDFGVNTGLSFIGRRNRMSYGHLPAGDAADRPSYPRLEREQVPPANRRELAEGPVAYWLESCDTVDLPVLQLFLSPGWSFARLEYLCIYEIHVPRRLPRPVPLVLRILERAPRLTRLRLRVIVPCSDDNISVTACGLLSGFLSSGSAGSAGSAASATTGGDDSQVFPHIRSMRIYDLCGTGALAGLFPADAETPRFPALEEIFHRGLTRAADPTSPHILAHLPRATEIVL